MIHTPKHIWLIRHGVTPWSQSGQHTGRTDIALTPAGEEKARAAGRILAGKPFALVLSSPRQRALETCRLAGYGDVVQIDDNLQEWDYGVWEGRTTADIRKELQNPTWTIWDDPVPGGERVEQVGERADRLIERALQVSDGDVAFFAHGHILRILGARWIGLPAKAGQLLALETGAISILGFERTTRVIHQWNMVPPD